jgi:membrane fusion protein, copper/silver efflux system
MRRAAIIATFALGLAAGVAIALLAIRPGAVTAPHEAVASPAPAARTTSASQPAASAGEVYIDPAMVQNLGVRTAAVEPRTITESIHTTGYVDYDQRRVTEVNARISGWIEKLHVAYVGQEVARGQKLLEIYSPELMLTQQDYLRSRRLAADQAGPEGPTRHDGRDLMTAAEDRLRLWGIPPSELKRLKEAGQVSETVPLEASAGGVVTECKAVEGAHVKAGDSLYTIADLSHVWIYADIYERELPRAHVGQPATVTSDALAGRVFTGKVTYIYPAVNEQTRTVKVRLEFANPHGDLKPGMYVKATLMDESPEKMLAVPTEAVLNSGLRRVVILALGDGRFRPREIEVGTESGGYFQVLGGLAQGDRVVTSAQFLIDSESNLHEAFDAMGQNQPAPGAAPLPERR